MNRFCVIGRNCGKLYGQPRRFFLTEKEAVAHASALISKVQSDGHAFVVQITKIVSTEPIPRVHVTDPED